MVNFKIRLYYFAKRIIPRRLQLALRRRLVMFKWGQWSNSWPKYELNAKLPPGWPGWPEGKKFALVLTHDIETQKGLDRCVRLMEIEESLGFRSAFNFVACGYTVSPEIRKELTERGFEVGVHGLHHNSSLFHSRAEFTRQAELINKTLRDWNAVGFRSPSMFHNLDWMHDLDIEYDASTFDMDPFEPQPDGVHTAFPMYVYDQARRRGYVELPYTLPQDFTLFVIMRHQTLDVWMEKLKWVISNGGMALMVTHPDYMNFEGTRTPYSEYDVGFYREFLEHIKSAYAGQYWHSLPRDIARFWASLFPNETSRS